jgi:hypothetical protein
MRYRGSFIYNKFHHEKILLEASHYSKRAWVNEYELLWAQLLPSSGMYGIRADYEWGRYSHGTRGLAYSILSLVSHDFMWSEYHLGKIASFLIDFPGDCSFAAEITEIIRNIAYVRPVREPGTFVYSGYEYRKSTMKGQELSLYLREPVYVRRFHNSPGSPVGLHYKDNPKDKNDSVKFRRERSLLKSDDENK